MIKAAFGYGLPPGGGNQTAKQINTLVEILEGVPDDEIAKRPRRFLGRNKHKGRLGTSYTSWFNVEAWFGLNGVIVAYLAMISNDWS
jgi:hypothetical protein